MEEEIREEIERLIKIGLLPEEIAQEGLGVSRKMVREIAAELGINPDVKDFKLRYNIPEEEYCKPRFRDTNKWEVSNRMLYGILWAEDIPLSVFAKVLGVSLRTLQRWVYQDQEPTPSHKKEAAKLLNIPADILWGDYAYKTSDIDLDIDIDN